MHTTRSVQVESQETEQDTDIACVTLFDDPNGIHIWFETEDGEASHTFSEAQFNTLVTLAKKLKGWP